MDLYEQDVVFVTDDDSGNRVIQLPITRIDNVEGAIKTVNGKSPTSDGNIVIPARNVGDEWHSFTGKIPAGGVPYCGQEVTRATYADLWNWVQAQGLVKTESEWQAIANSQNGNVPFYSDGDGSTTFRMPKIVGYIKGTDSTNSAGSYVKEGLPNIQGQIGIPVHDYHSNTASGAFRGTNFQAYIGYRSGSLGEVSTQNTYGYYFNASLSNSIYGNSAHVTPETSFILFGVYAFGEVAVTGSTTTDSVATGLARVEANLGNYLPLAGGTMTGGIHFYDTTSGMRWTTSNGDIFHLRPYAPGNLFQITKTKNGEEWGAFNLHESGDFELTAYNGPGTTSHSFRGGVNGNASWNGTMYAAAFQISSDIRLKSDLQPISNALSKVSQLTPYTYIKQGIPNRQAGVIAQHVEKVLPEAVSVNDDGFKAVDYNQLVGLLIGAINQLADKVDRLESMLQLPDK